MQKKRYGYRKLHMLLIREGWQVNHKRIYRLYREHNLALRRKIRKRLPVRQVAKLIVPDKPNQSWSLDFMSDCLSSGRRFRILNIMDDFNREALHIEIDTSLTAQRVVMVLEQLHEFRGLPEQIRLDNGPELISNHLAQWAEQHQVHLAFIEPGKPAQNAFIERFNGIYREECLNLHAFETIHEVRLLTHRWMNEYNYQRPHMSLDYRTPKEYVYKYSKTLKTLHF